MSKNDKHFFICLSGIAITGLIGFLFPKLYMIQIVWMYCWGGYLLVREYITNS